MPNFQLLVKNFKKNKPRRSALYNLLHTKLQPCSAARTELAFNAQTTNAKLNLLGLDQYQHKIDSIIFKEKINAYLIFLKNHNDINNLAYDPNCKLKDRHIRIDLDYGVPSSTLSEKLFMNWHYTERWDKGSEGIEIHAYFHHGIFQSLWIRNSKNSLNTQEHDIARILATKKNATDAHKIVLDLLEKTQVHREKVQHEFEQAIEQLSIEYLGLFSDEELNTKFLECEAKQEELNNFLEDYYDPRFEILVTNIQKALEMKASSPQVTLEEEEEEETTKEAAAAYTVVLTPAPPATIVNKVLTINQIKNNVEQLCQKVKKAIDKCDGQKLLTLQFERENLETEIVIAHFNANHQTTLDDLNQQHIKLQNITSLATCLQQFALNGKVEPFKTILPKIVNALSFAFIEKYMLHIINKHAFNQQQAYLKICEELFASSSTYRMFISLMKRSASGYLHAINNEKVYYSPYFRMLRNSNFDLLTTLLKQSSDLNIDALVINGRAISLLSIAIELKIDHKYIKFLLDNGALIEQARGAEHRLVDKTSLLQGELLLFSNNNVPASIISQRQNALARNNAQHQEWSLIHHLTEFNSSLIALVQDARYLVDILKIMAPASNTENLVLALAKLSIQKDIGSVTCWADRNHTITFAQEAQERIKIAQQRAVESYAPKKHVSLIFGSINPQANIFLKEFIAYVNAKLKAFSPEQIEQAAINLFKFGIEQGIKGIPLNTLIAFRAVIILECFNKCSLASHLRIVAALVKVGNSYRASSFLEPEFAERQAISNFTNAKNFANFSLFSEQLRQSKAFLDACINTNQNMHVVTPNSARFSLRG